MTDDGTETGAEELESWTVAPPAPAGEFSATVQAVIVPGTSEFAAQVSPLSKEAEDVTLIEPAVVVTVTGSPPTEAPSAFESAMEVTPWGAPAVSASETVARAPLEMMLEFRPSAMQV